MCLGVHIDIQTPPHCNLIDIMTATPPFIAQQYFPAISVALHPHSRKEKLGAPFKNVAVSVFFLCLKFSRVSNGVSV